MTAHPQVLVHYHLPYHPHFCLYLPLALKTPAHLFSPQPNPLQFLKAPHQNSEGTFQYHQYQLKYSAHSPLHPRYLPHSPEHFWQPMYFAPHHHPVHYRDHMKFAHLHQWRYTQNGFSLMVHCNESAHADTLSPHTYINWHCNTGQDVSVFQRQVKRMHGAYLGTVKHGNYYIYFEYIYLACDGRGNKTCKTCKIPPDMYLLPNLSDTCHKRSSCLTSAKTEKLEILICNLISHTLGSNQVYMYLQITILQIYYCKTNFKEIIILPALQKYPKRNITYAIQHNLKIQ